MSSAKEKLKKYFLDHIGEDIPREKLRDVAGNIQDWPRAVRSLRQETGLEINHTQTGYILTSSEPIRPPQIRKTIDNKTKYAVLQRDNSTCQRCGANIYNTPNVKLVIDHKLPVDLGGETILDNLWTLCSDCNGGKQAFFQDDNTEQTKEIMQMNSATKRLKAYFEMNPNTVIEPIKLSAIANVRDWERTLRSVRANEKMNIRWIRPNTEYPRGGYIYTK